VAYVDPEREHQRLEHQQHAARCWRLLRELVDYGNSTDWPTKYRERNATALAVQRTLPGLLDRIEDGTVHWQQFKAGWTEWAEAVTNELDEPAR
jgi:hypothetical protein